MTVKPHGYQILPYLHPLQPGAMRGDGTILLEHGRVAGGVAKWQEILDTYPTYTRHEYIEGQIIKLLELK